MAERNPTNRVSYYLSHSEAERNTARVNYRPRHRGPSWTKRKSARPGGVGGDRCRCPRWVPGASGPPGRSARNVTRAASGAPRLPRALCPRRLHTGGVTGAAGRSPTAHYPWSCCSTWRRRPPPAVRTLKTLAASVSAPLVPSFRFVATARRPPVGRTAGLRLGTPKFSR